MKTILLGSLTALLLFTITGCADSSNAAGSMQPNSSSQTAPTIEVVNQPLKSSAENKINEIKYTTPNGEDGYVYISDAVLNEPNVNVPLVLMMCGTGHEAREDAKSSGWVDKGLEENLIVLAPNYNNAATYSQAESLVSVVEYITETYPVDTTRVYSTGFSNGGAASVVLCRDYPHMFAAISAMGWMVDMQGQYDRAAAYDMPFQVIQGTEEYTQVTQSGTKAVMEDEQRAIKDLFVFNEMPESNQPTDYDAAPYWGYVPKDTQTISPDGRTWTISNYYKESYTAPFAQFVLIEGADHRTNEHEATIAWDFFKQFSRGADGSVAVNK